MEGSEGLGGECFWECFGGIGTWDVLLKICEEVVGMPVLEG